LARLGFDLSQGARSMNEIDWAERALESEIAYSRACGSRPTAYPGFVHLYNDAVPWGGDFNCAVGVRLTDYASFERAADRVARIHREKKLDRPDRYDIYPPPLDRVWWDDYLAQRGYSLQMSIWFCAPTIEGHLPAEFTLFAPAEDEYIEWYHRRQKEQSWYDDAYLERLRPLQQRFARVFRPYWLLRGSQRLGWVYCGYLGDYGSLFDVWIEPAFRGHGLGRILMNAIRIEGRKYGTCSLLVRTSEGRRGFYEKCGFRECLRSSTIRLRAS
jgi:ribosomal protein S18 acetylase RimI-like enzyme